MRCSAVTGPVFAGHDRPGHAESHDRLVQVIAALPPGLAIHEPAAAARADLERVHQPGYLDWLERQCRKHADFCFVGEYAAPGGYVDQNSFVAGFIDQNTYINPCSYDVAVHAAGSSVLAMERALSGECCFALVRPPGHHAGAANAMGFCLLNNIAVAAGAALSSADRVAIVDWDAHHGNGTQEIFSADDRVLYCSVHDRDAFPRTGGADETGNGPGAGLTLNVPLPGGSGIAEYACAFSGVILPALARFRPDLVLVSAGQDMLADDPLGGMKLLPPDAGWMAARVLETAGSPLALVLEGGYGPSHGEAVRHIFSALGGNRYEREIPAAGRATQELVARLRHLHRL